MQWLVFCVLALFVYGGGGVTKQSGLEQFWTDDYKIFEQVYGKTSDKDIYGDKLPPSITNNNDKAIQASDKNERYLLNYQEDLDPYSFGDKFNILNKKPLKLNNPAATSTINFISYNDFKPISEHSDPETYNYLKKLEESSKEFKYDTPKIDGGFKPIEKLEETDAYKSIQDILDAHEANKGKDEVKYLNYGKKRGKPRKQIKKRKCVTRCRKRSVYRRRPYGLKTVLKY